MTTKQQFIDAWRLRITIFSSLACNAQDIGKYEHLLQLQDKMRILINEIADAEYPDDNKNKGEVIPFTIKVENTFVNGQKHASFTSSTIQGAWDLFFASMYYSNIDYTHIVFDDERHSVTLCFSSEPNY